MSYVVKINGESRTLEKKASLLSLLSEEDRKTKKYIAAKVNNKTRELEYEVYYDAEIEYLDCSSIDAMKIYEASLRYVVAMAFHNLYPELKIRFAYNVSRSISIHLLDPKVCSNTNMLIRVRKEIQRLIDEDLPLVRMVVPNEEAEKIYKERDYQDKMDLLKYRPEKTVHFYRCGEYMNYMYCRLVPSTGYLTKWKLLLYAPGFMLQYPRAECNGEIPTFEDAPTFMRTLKESHDWAKIISADTVGKINEKILKAGPVEFINLCEARHNRMLCELGQLIEDDIDDIRLVFIAGPSSSGKTTFANRLRIELLSRGISPIRISIDDYYLEKSKVPLGPDGAPDLENIAALDIEQFNDDMVALISGEEVDLPRFDFELGHQVFGRKVKLGKNQPIIVEGIHALNDSLTPSIPNTDKFKIFISPQAQINLDDHNPVSLTDLRLLRRLVRDKKFRGAPAEETFSMWPSVRAGEFKWIYAHQEGADFVFNSYLPYELPVMKNYAMPLLTAIDKDSPYFMIAERLIRMLKYFVALEDTWVPSNSLMREFIGGSCYKDV